MKKVTFLLASVMILTACNLNITPKEKKDFEGVYFDNVTYVYDGNSHILNEVRGAPEDTLITYIGRDSYIDAGVYEASALLQKDGYNDLTLNATLTITNASFSSIRFDSQTIEYDGQEHAITVTNLPSFASVSYQNNIGTEVGTYDARATITAPNYNELVLTARLTITAPLLDFDDAQMNDLEVDYDGQSHTIEPTGYPDDTTVTYKGTHSYVNVGTYTISCTLSKEGYHSKDLSAILTINAVSFENLVFEDAYSLYNGKSHSITVKNAPLGSTISYKCLNANGTNSFTNIGSYEIEATVSHKNYLSEKLTATLNIIGRDDLISEDENKDAFRFDEVLKWDDVFPVLLEGNYTCLIYSSNRESLDDPIVFDEDSYWTKVACDGKNAVIQSTHREDREDKFDFYNTIGADVAIGYFGPSYDEIEFSSKFPLAALDETVLQYYPARAFVALSEDEDGYIVPGIDNDDYYYDVGTYEVKEDNTLYIKHEHKHGSDGNYFYQIFEFYNVGNTKIVGVDSFAPSIEKVETLPLTGDDFYIDGVRYGSHLISTYNSGSQYMAHTVIYYWLQLLIEPGVHYVLPLIYDQKIERAVFWYYQEQPYSINMDGYELNVYFDEEGNYQGEYSYLRSVVDRLSRFESYGGAVHYYDEWANAL